MEFIDDSGSRTDAIEEVLLQHINCSNQFTGKELVQAYEAVTNSSPLNQTEERLLIALMNNIARATAIDSDGICVGLNILDELPTFEFNTTIRDRINADLQLLARHISKLTDLDENLLSTLFYTSNNWKFSPSAGNVLNALIQPLSSHDQLNPSQIDYILRLLGEVGPFEEHTTLMNLLGMHIWGGAKDFDSDTISHAVSCLRYMTNNSEQVLHALTRRVSEINITSFKPISIAANIHRLSPLLQNQSSAAKKFVATLLKKLNFIYSD